MQNTVRRPPRLIIPEIVLRKTAGVQDAKMRTDARPFVRRRLATIIKSGPVKSAGGPGADGEETPPFFGRLAPTRIVVVVGADITARGVIGINTACADAAGLLSAKDFSRWKGRVISIHAFKVVIKPFDFKRRKDAKVA